MPPPYLQDEYGLWEQLGFVTPKVDGWQKCQYPTTLNKTMYRFTFIGDFSLVESFCWVRIIVDSLPEPLVLPAKRYYIKTRPFILEMPLPEYLLLRSPRWVQQVEIRKQISWSNRRWGITNDSDYQLKIEVTGV